MRTLDFKLNKVEVLTLDELEQTYRENHVDGTPVGGIYHFELIERLLELFTRQGLHPEVVEVFAAQNRERLRPGVTVLPAVEERDGRGALSAHLLRRVYANIAIRDDETDETVTNLAVAYHQKGIQVGIGPMVKVCHNQTILGAADVASNYACYGYGLSNESRTVGSVLERAAQWAAGFGDDATRRDNIRRGMQQKPWTHEDCLHLLGSLMELRVRHDSPDARIHRAATYPLNSAQINIAAESLLTAEADFMVKSWWDAYQRLNTLLNPRQTDIPQILPQQLVLIETLTNEMTYGQH